MQISFLKLETHITDYRNVNSMLNSTRKFYISAQINVFLCSYAHNHFIALCLYEYLHMNVVCTLRFFFRIETHTEFSIRWKREKASLEDTVGCSHHVIGTNKASSANVSKVTSVPVIILQRYLQRDKTGYNNNITIYNNIISLV